MKLIRRLVRRSSHTITTLVACLICGGGCCTEHGGKAASGLLDEDGNVCDVLLPSMTFEKRSESFVLGRILSEAQRRITSRTVEMSLHVRDVRPTPKPQSRILRSQELLAIAGNPDDPRASGRVWIPLHGLSMSQMLSVLAEMCRHECLVDTYGDPKSISVHVGTPELVGNNWQRLAYHVPEGLKHGMVSLPTHLEDTGECIAYDPAEGVVVVIAPRDAAAFKLLQTFGFPPITEE